MKRTQRIPVEGGVALAIGGVALVLLGILLDRDRWIGGVAWTLIAAYGMYRFGLWLAGPHLLPIEPERESRERARAVLQRFAGGQKTLMATVREGLAPPGPGGKAREVTQGEGALLVDSTSIVALVTDTGLSRIKGPGIHFTRKGERIGRIVDLRVQAQSKGVIAQTRDGMWVKFRVNTRFQIDEVKSQKVQDVDRGKVKWPAPYTWSPRPVTRALGLERAGPDDNVRWDEIAPHEAVKRVHNLIANYTYDELTEPRNPLINRREDIRKSLEDEVKNALAGSGIKVLGIKLSQFVPRDETIDRQRIDSWQAEWTRRRKIVEAEGEAKSRRKLELARAQAQMDTMTRLIEALDASGRAGANNADLVALRFLEVVESLAKDAETQKKLGQVRQKLLGGGTSGGVHPSG